MKGPAGYGRYDDDPNHVGCPRARTDMTPCIARDGCLALTDDGHCVGCNARPARLLTELRPKERHWRGTLAEQADRLSSLVRELTEPLVRKGADDAGEEADA
jgi:hypothetical protein